MDITRLMNDGQSEEEKRQPVEPQRGSQPLAPPPLATNTPSRVPSNYGLQSHQQTPLHPPLSGGSLQQLENQGLTPLKTPSQGQVPAQYPFPAQAAQSPASGIPGQQYRPFESHSASTPNARPLSHGHLFPAPSPSQQLPTSLPQGVHAHANTSVSPTPSSHHSQTPHSVRQSPMSAMSHAPNQPLPQYPHQHSQPSTPLGPPPLYHQRSSNLSDIHSPFHQRTFSGASNGLISGSPAQHQPGMGNLVGSPDAYNRHSPQQLRRTSEYLVREERERSVSVSPKTKVPPRPPSLESRQSSQQGTLSSRSSAQKSLGFPAGSPSHVTAQQQFGVAPHAFGQPPHPANAVSQTTPPQAQGVPNPFGANTGSGESSLSRQASYNQPPFPSIQHQSQKMGMNHLLTPTSEVPPTVNGSSAGSSGPDMAVQKSESSSNSGQFSGMPGQIAPSASRPNNEQRQQQQAQIDGQVSSPPLPIPPKVPAAQQAPTVPNNSKILNEAQPPVWNDSKPQLKRQAEAGLSDERPAKQKKTTPKYSQRPIWATLSKHNPRFNQQRAQNGTAGGQGAQQQRAPPQLNGGSVQQPNGQPNTDGFGPNAPRDEDLIHARHVLGQWEKTFKWNTPHPDMLRYVQDWLFMEISQLGDVGTDPKEGTIEIEAKIGTLLRDGERCKLPVTTATVIAPQANRAYQFESQMDVTQHKAMNDFLNTSVQDSHKAGRVRMKHKHIRETDSFHTLSKLGQQSLPQSLQRRQNTREPRLRITRDTTANVPPDQPKPILARIVKLPINHLHIFNPGYNYDCRISINLEVNLDRPDLDLAELIAEEAGTNKQSKEVDRIKDRMSYKHLAYSVDLTRVDREGLGPTFELELEVDSNLMREEMGKIRARGDNAYTDVVSGFLDNATFLMRQRPV